jgi:hypothetical protein
MKQAIKDAGMPPEVAEQARRVNMTMRMPSLRKAGIP